MVGKKVGFVVLISGCVLASGAAFVILKNDKDYSKPQTLQAVKEQAVFETKEYGIKLMHPSDVTVADLSDDDKAANVVLRLEQYQSPQYIITMRGEKGLKGPAQISKLDIIDLVTNGAIGSLPTRYDGFEMISQQKRMFREIEGYEIIFTYLGPSGQTAKQKLLLLSANDDNALYISMQALESDFAALESSIFSSLIDSIEPLYGER